jgi:enoyl-[acyl-carrier-protein] reductase (NADH)
MAKRNLFALILGVSSGFGKATALELARKGYNIYGVHLDMGAKKKEVELFRQELEALGVVAQFFNANAASDDARAKIISAIQKDLQEREGENILRVFVHSIAFGAIKRFFHPEREQMIDRRGMEMTMDVMANSFVYWIQDLGYYNLLAENSRLFAMTSIGSMRAMGYYGAISGAKAALEAYVRQIALELAPLKITCNAIMAGMTDTPAGAKIPGFQYMLQYVREHNPFNRNTVPEDVAQAVAMLADEKFYWITGQTIPVDGGETILNFVEEIEDVFNKRAK